MTTIPLKPSRNYLYKFSGNEWVDIKNVITFGTDDSNNHYLTTMLGEIIVVAPRWQLCKASVNILDEEIIN